MWVLTFRFGSCVSVALVWDMHRAVLWFGLFMYWDGLMQLVWACDCSVCLFTFGFIVFVALIAWSLIHESEHCVLVVNEQHDLLSAAAVDGKVSGRLIQGCTYSLFRDIPSKRFGSLKHIYRQTKDVSSVYLAVAPD